MIIPNAILAAIFREAAKRAFAYANGDEPDVGHNAGKHTLVPMNQFKGHQLYEYLPDDADPMRFIHHASGYEFMAGHFYGTDLGSIPRLLQSLFPRKYLRLAPTDFIEAYIPHDHVCAMRWIWVRKGPDAPWNQMAMTKKHGDVLLHWILSAPTLGNPPISATRLEAFAIYQAVRKEHALHGE